MLNTKQYTAGVSAYVKKYCADHSTSGLLSGLGAEDTPIGTVISFLGTTAPRHYLLCDGTVYNIADYQDLADFIAEQFGSVDHFGGDGSTTFAVPDLRGEFLRGAGTNSHANQGNGAAVGEHQDGTEHKNIGVNPVQKTIWSPASVDGIGAKLDSTIVVSNRTGISSGSGATWSAGGDDRYTSRPTNTSVNYCIKYEKTFHLTVDGFLKYSTDEIVVGEWIDGKPIYRKVVYLGNCPSASGNKSVEHGIENIERYTAIYGFARWPNGSCQTLPYVSVPSPNTSITLMNNGVGAISISVGMDRSTVTVTAILEYTKTTDIAS